MKLTTMILGSASAAVVAVPIMASTAAAQDSLYVPLLTYRTGAFAGSGIPIANGMNDYLAMLNARDGGIGGVRIDIEECETGYTAEKGVECYEKTKAKGPLMQNPWSTAITLQIIPKASVDKIPVLAMAYGLSAAAVGDVFPWVFNPPATYWDGASAVIKHIAEEEGGFENLEGKKIGFIYLDAGYGREPIPLLEDFQERYGFELTLYPVAGSEMQNQSSTWLGVDRDDPDYMIIWGWGAMNPTAVKEAANIGFPMEKFYGIWWSGGDDDARPAGDGAIGYRTLNFHGTGTDYPAIQDILEHVVEPGNSRVDSVDRVGENLYNRGVYNSVLIAEAIHTAQQITGKDVVNSEDVRRGLENLDITAERLKEIGLEGFMSPVKVTCEDHNGHHPVYMQEWDGKKWQPISDWFEPMKDVVRPMLEQAAAEYVAANQPWTERTEPCD
jgi:branched-chain amino acid transport system substrate-binding protein